MGLQTLAETLASRKQLVSTDIPTGFNKVKTTDTTGTTNTKRYDADELFDLLPDLTNPRFKAWYCKMFYALGRTRVLELASVARADGKQPSKLFSLLLKRAIDAQKCA